MGSLGELVGASAPRVVADGHTAQMAPRNCSGALPRLFHHPPTLLGLQVLSPVRRAAAGVEELNRRLQPLINPPAPQRAQMPLFANPILNSKAEAEAVAAGLPSPPAWRVGDRVVQTANDYDRATWNGDLGYIIAVDQAKREVMVRYPAAADDGGGSGRGATPAEAALGFTTGGRLVLYSSKEVADQLQLAWATTVHKVRASTCIHCLLRTAAASPSCAQDCAQVPAGCNQRMQITMQAHVRICRCRSPCTIPR